MTANIVTDKNALAVAEQAELVRLESVIEKGKKTFVAVGLALAEVRDRRLYRGDYGSFTEYCEARWGWAKDYSNKLISAANVVTSLPPETATIVATESQARELAKVPEDKRVEVLAVAKASGKPITAKSIKTAAVEIQTPDVWRQDELDRQALVLKGQTVLANAHHDHNLIAWAEAEGLAVRIDRKSIYGNPWILGEDGTRDEVCDHYEKIYLPTKPSILKQIPELRGKVLICWCYPERCHGLSLIKSIKTAVVEGTGIIQRGQPIVGPATIIQHCAVDGRIVTPVRSYTIGNPEPYAQHPVSVSVDFVNPRKRRGWRVVIVPTNLEYLTIEAEEKTVYDSRQDVPCDMDEWTATNTRFEPGRREAEQEQAELNAYMRGRAA